MHLAGQIIGIIGFIFSIVAFLQKKDNNMRNFLGVSSTIVAVSYYLTGAYAGALIIFTSAIRNFIAARGGVAKKMYWPFVALNIGAAAFSYRQPYDVLALIGVLCSTTSVFRFSGLKFRYGMIVSCSFWLSYNIVTMSIGPMMMESFNIGALGYAVYRIKHGEKPAHEVKSE